jgi:hypothetical protein
MAHQTGIDIRRDRNGNLIIPTYLCGADGEPITTGTVDAYIAELQEDGSLATLDFADNVFKVTTCTTPTIAATQQSIDGGTVDTGLWTVVLSYAQQANFVAGQHYIVYWVHMEDGVTTVHPPRWWQWGGVEGEAATEAELAAEHGDGLWTNIAGTGAYAITLVFSDGAGRLAGGLAVAIRDLAGNTVAGPLATDTAGRVTYYLDAGDYFVVTPSTALWNGANTPITVMGETTIEIELTLNTIPAPPDADYCRVFVYAKEPDGSVPDSGVFSLERIHSPATVGEGATTVTIVLGDDSRALDDNGYSYLDILQGARVDLALTTHGRKVPILKRNVTVPTAATANWETLA